jgi:hypothetical protein
MSMHDEASATLNAAQAAATVALPRRRNIEPPV